MVQVVDEHNFVADDTVDKINSQYSVLDAKLGDECELVGKIKTRSSEPDRKLEEACEQSVGENFNDSDWCEGDLSTVNACEKVDTNNIQTTVLNIQNSAIHLELMKTALSSHCSINHDEFPDLIATCEDTSGTATAPLTSFCDMLLKKPDIHLPEKANGSWAPKRVHNVCYWFDEKKLKSRKKVRGKKLEKLHSPQKGKTWFPHAGMMHQLNHAK